MENKVFHVKVEGKNTRESLASYMEGAKRLDPQKVANGQIWIRTIGSNADGSISLLFLGPEAKVGMHPHPTDAEVYNTMDGNAHMCSVGCSHSLENTSKSHWAMVISTKWKPL